MELLKDLQANIEKTDEFKQSNREAALKDPLALVADGVGSLGWVVAPKPHEYINDLFGGAQMYGNNVLKEYRDKYAPCNFPLLVNPLTHTDRRIRSLSSGFRRTTSFSKPCPNMPKNTIPTA